MEIPASGRLFMGHRHVARIAGERSVSPRSMAHRPHDCPAGTTITGRPFTFLERRRHGLPWWSSAGRYCGFVYPCCSRCKGWWRTGEEGTCRPLRILHVRITYDFNKYEVSNKSCRYLEINLQRAISINNIVREIENLDLKLRDQVSYSLFREFINSPILVEFHSQRAISKRVYQR